MRRKLGIFIMAVAMLTVGAISASAQRRGDYDKHRTRSGRVILLPENRNWGWGNDRWDRRENRREERFDRRFERREDRFDRRWDRRWDNNRWDRRPRIRIRF
jgi:hypothetical protein